MKSKIERCKVALCLPLIVVILMMWIAVPASTDSPMPQNKVPGWVEKHGSSSHERPQEGRL